MHAATVSKSGHPMLVTAASNCLTPSQVRHRCPCTDTDQCGEEAKLVSSLAKEGRMTPLGTG